MLNETTGPIVEPSVMTELSRHLRLPEGSNVDPDDAAILEDALRAAMAHTEARLGLALLKRTFVWRGLLGKDRCVTPPVSPVHVVVATTRILPGGHGEAIDPAFWRLDETGTRTRICCSARLSTPVEIEFVAGLGATWPDVPADLRRAVIMLAAHYFEARHAADTRTDTAVPFGVAALLAPWRRVRCGATA